MSHHGSEPSERQGAGSSVLPGSEDRQRADLKAYLDGELAAPRLWILRWHLARCPECREEIAWLKRLGEDMKDLEKATPRPELRARILANLPSTPPGHAADGKPPLNLLPVPETPTFATTFRRSVPRLALGGALAVLALGGVFAMTRLAGRSAEPPSIRPPVTVPMPTGAPPPAIGRKAPSNPATPPPQVARTSSRRDPFQAPDSLVRPAQKPSPGDGAPLELPERNPGERATAFQPSPRLPKSQQDSMEPLVVPIPENPDAPPAMRLALATRDVTATSARLHARIRKLGGSVVALSSSVGADHSVSQESAPTKQPTARMPASYSVIEVQIPAVRTKALLSALKQIGAVRDLPILVSTPSAAPPAALQRPKAPRLDVDGFGNMPRDRSNTDNTVSAPGNAIRTSPKTPGRPEASGPSGAPEAGQTVHVVVVLYTPSL